MKVDSRKKGTAIFFEGILHPRGVILLMRVMNSIFWLHISALLLIVAVIFLLNDATVAFFNVLATNAVRSIPRVQSEYMHLLHRGETEVAKFYTTIHFVWILFSGAIFFLQTMLAGAFWLLYRKGNSEVTYQFHSIRSPAAFWLLTAFYYSTTYSFFATGGSGRVGLPDNLSVLAIPLALHILSSISGWSILFYVFSICNDTIARNE